MLTTYKEVSMKEYIIALITLFVLAVFGLIGFFSRKLIKDWTESINELNKGLSRTNVTVAKLDTALDKTTDLLDRQNSEMTKKIDKIDTMIDKQERRLVIVEQCLKNKHI